MISGPSSYQDFQETGPCSSKALVAILVKILHYNFPLKKRIVILIVVILNDEHIISPLNI